MIVGARPRVTVSRVAASDSTSMRYALSDDRPETLDIGRRWLDVRRIGRSVPAYRWCVQAGWDRDDLDNELIARVIARQQLPSRYDPSRGCVSKYLWTLCSSILSNLATSQRHLGSPLELLVDADPASEDHNLSDTVSW